MIIRVYSSGKLDLETVGDMLWQADAQANFHPDARWINQSTFGTEDKGGKTRVYREFAIRWIGRESVIMWLPVTKFFLKWYPLPYFRRKKRLSREPFQVGTLLNN